MLVMTFKLNKDNEFNITIGQGIKAYNSLRNECIFYISSIVKNTNVEDCDVLFVITDTTNNMYSALLQKTEETMEEYIKYEIDIKQDFSLKNSKYQAYIIIYNPQSNTHISSTTANVNIVESNESVFLENNIDVITKMSNEIQSMKLENEKNLIKIQKLTELNIAINNELQCLLNKNNVN